MMRHLSHCFAFAIGLVFLIPANGSAKAISASPPTLAAHAAAAEKFVPAGWRLWQIRHGDLNKDGISDAVMIIQRGDSSDSYTLAVVFGNPAGGFDLAAENYKILNGIPDGDFVCYPLSDEFRIRHGAFTVRMQKEGPGGAAAISFTFRYQNGQFLLIGYDYLGDHRGWVKLSFDMLTGQVVETEGSVYEGNEYVVEKRKEGTFIPPKPITLDLLGNGFDFNDDFNPFKYEPRR